MNKFFLATVFLLFTTLGVFSQSVARATETVRSGKTLISEVKTIFTKKGEPKKTIEPKAVAKPKSAQPAKKEECDCKITLPIQTSKMNHNHYHSVINQDGYPVVVAVNKPVRVRPRIVRQPF